MDEPTPDHYKALGLDNTADASTITSDSTTDRPGSGAAPTSSPIEAIARDARVIVGAGFMRDSRDGRLVEPTTPTISRRKLL